MSGPFLKPDDPLPDFLPLEGGSTDRAPAGHAEIAGASWEAMRSVELTSSRADNEKNAYATIRQQVLEDFGGDEQAMHDALMALDVPAFTGMSAEDRVRLSVGSAYDRSMAERFAVYRDALPPERREKIQDPRQIELLGRQAALKRYLAAEETLGEVDTPGEWATMFGAGMAAAMTDPANIGAMIAFRRPLTTFRGAVAYNAATSGGVEILLQPFVQQYRSEVGLPAGFDIGLTNVLYATAGGAVFGAVEGGFIKLGQALEAKRLRGQATRIDGKIAEILKRHEAGEIDAEEVRAQLRTLEEEEPAFAAAMEIVRRRTEADAEAEANPFGMSPEEIEAHRVRLANAEAEAMGQPRPFDEDEFEAPLPSAESVVPPEWSSLGLEVVDYSRLARDPQRFQFKESDSDGVTDALRDVDTWEPERAGLLLLWEAEDGTRYVANGHQRHALALRLMDEGHEAITGPAIVLREADGVTAEMAMVKGALVNIAEGSGSSIDAARILRVDPEAADTLPPRSPLVREARGLAMLSEDAFGLVINGRVSPRDGSIVGKLVEDPALQGQISLALARANPATAAEAQSIVRDMLAVPVVEGRTLDLFGEAEFRQALIAERAKVKSAVMQILRMDQRVFSMLTKQADRIEAEGNTLDAGANEDVRMSAARLAERIDKEAHVKGEISDALNDAARLVAAGTPPRTAAKGLVDALARAAEGGGQRRRPDPGGRGADTPEGRRAEGGAERDPAADRQAFLEARAGAILSADERRALLFPETGPQQAAADILADAADEFGPDVAALIGRTAPEPEDGQGGLFAKRLSGFHDDLERGTEPFWDDRLLSTQNKAVEMARNGYTNWEIAEELQISPGSVSVYLTWARRLGIDVPSARGNRLAEARQEILRMRERGFPNKEIAAATGKSEVNVRVILSNERRRLRDAGEDIPDWLQPNAGRFSKTLRSANEMPDADVLAWAATNVRETKHPAGQDEITFLLNMKLPAGMKGRDVEVQVELNTKTGTAIVDMTLDGLTEGAVRGAGRQVAAIQTFFRSMLALRAFALQHPEVKAFRFAGSTDAHDRMYEGFLRRFELAGFEGYKVTRAKSELDIGADGTISGGQPRRNGGSFVLVRAGERPENHVSIDGLTKTETDLAGGRRRVTTRLAEAEPVRPRSDPDGGSGSGRPGDGGADPAGGITAERLSPPGGRFAKSQRPNGFFDDAERGSDLFFDERLSPQENKAVEMARNGYSSFEIAEEMQVRPNQVAVLLSRARRKLEGSGIDIPYSAQGRPLQGSRKQTVLDIAARSPGLYPHQIAERAGLTPTQVSLALSQERARLLSAGETIPDWLQPKSSKAARGYSKDATDEAPGVVLTREETLFLRDEAARFERALAEAAACAGGVPMKGAGQIVALTLLGAGGAAAATGAALTHGSPETRAERSWQAFTLEPGYEAEAREYRKRKNAADQRDYYRTMAAEQEGWYRGDLNRIFYANPVQMNGLAARFTGINPGFLDRMLVKESSRDWTARPPINPETGRRFSSAYGGFQFLERDWLRAMSRWGPSYGFDPAGMTAADILELRADPRWGTVMAAELARDNARILERTLRRPVTERDAYLAHFAGPRTAGKLLAADPDAAADKIDPAAAAANPTIYYADKARTRPRTVRQVISRLTGGFPATPVFQPAHTEAER